MITLEDLKTALALTNIDAVSAQMQMAPAGRARMQPLKDKPPRQSAVLILIYPDEHHQLRLILTKRTDHLKGHSGQVSFPGGRRDPEDITFQATALRETCEELGICDEPNIAILGQLTDIWIPPSNFDVVPVVAFMSAAPDITPSDFEVAEVFSLSLDDLCSDKLKRTQMMEFRGQPIEVPYYDVEGHVVWGATCMILSELEQRLNQVKSEQTQ